MMQPLLLLKQTLEATYDPGPILLNGPNVKFTSADQLLSKTKGGQSAGSFEVGMRLETGDGFQLRFRKEHRMGFIVDQMKLASPKGESTLWPGMTEADILKTGITQRMEFTRTVPQGFLPPHWQVMPDRCFLNPVLAAKGPGNAISFSGSRRWAAWETIVPQIIHLPGLRGNPERTYPVTAVGTNYSGTFENYTASIVSQWMANEEETLAEVNADLKLLKLTGGVTAAPVNDVQIELHVGRLPDVAPDRPGDRVNIADVGVGVSQVLPVLVALHAVKSPRLVYVEQPETHLHPRAQFALAQILAAAAKRGVRIVAETHSSLLLLGVQSLVAEGKLEPNLVKLHWFQRDESGQTIIHSSHLDEAGRFGDWPEDFDDVTLQAQKGYLDAAESKLFAK